MNLTLSVDERTVEKARAVAKSMGKSLNQVLREYLELMSGESSVEEDIAEFRRLTALGGGRSRGWVFNRDEIHKRR